MYSSIYPSIYLGTRIHFKELPHSVVDAEMSNTSHQQAGDSGRGDHIVLVRVQRPSTRKTNSLNSNLCLFLKAGEDPILSSSAFSSIQVFIGLDEQGIQCPDGGRQSASLNLLAQMFIFSRNTHTVTPRLMFNQMTGLPGPSQVDT